MNFKNKIIVKSDVLNISNRLKNIDAHYFLVYNKSTKFYEVHNSKNANNTFEFSTNYSNIDSRIIDVIYKKLSQNKIDIFKLVEENNARIEEKNNNNLSDEMNIKFNSIHKYANNGVKEFTDIYAFDNKWV